MYFFFLIWASLYFSSESMSKTYTHIYNSTELSFFYCRSCDIIQFVKPFNRAFDHQLLNAQPKFSTTSLLESIKNETSVAN